MSINRVNISGNLTRDPEMRVTQGGTSILSFGVAVNDRRRNPKTGEWEDVPNFVDCVVFGNRAEPLSRFLSKGSKVAIEGKLRWSQWERDGQKRSKLEVIVDECDFLSQRQNQGQQQAPQAPAAPARQGYAQPPQQYQAPQQYQQAPVAPQQAQQAPQAPQGYQNLPAQGYAQNPAPQAPTAPAQQPPASQYQQPYQPTLPQQYQQAPAMDVYDEDIPF